MKDTAKWLSLEHTFNGPRETVGATTVKATLAFDGYQSPEGDRKAVANEIMATYKTFLKVLQEDTELGLEINHKVIDADAGAGIGEVEEETPPRKKRSKKKTAKKKTTRRKSSPKMEVVSEKVTLEKGEEDFDEDDIPFGDGSEDISEEFAWGEEQEVYQVGLGLVEKWWPTLTPKEQNLVALACVCDQVFFDDPSKLSNSDDPAQILDDVVYTYTKVDKTLAECGEREWNLLRTAITANLKTYMEADNNE